MGCRESDVVDQKATVRSGGDKLVVRTIRIREFCKDARAGGAVERCG